MREIERIMREATKSEFPHVSIRCTKESGHTLILSTGQELELGKVHPDMLEHLFTTVKTFNMLSADPKMISVDRINSQFN